MGHPTVADTYLKVKDMNRAIDFYEAFLGVQAEYRYMERWVSINDRLGLYNPSYDVHHGVPLTEYDRELRIGNNVVIVFSSDDVDADHERVQSLGATGITEIIEINLIAPYRFFQFKDPDGNIVEVGRMG
ncbi:MAG TPA: VOC family protein [Anaerolineae bacterium]|nr:VOC family protein [Anaerolineae bacterium]